LRKWILIEGNLSPQDGRQLAYGLLEDRPLEIGGHPLSASPSGLVNEIVQIGPEVTGVDDVRLSIRTLGWAERTLRMAYRVVRTWWSLSFSQRRQCRLSLIGACFDLAGSYHIATQFRGICYGTWVAEVDTLTEQDRARICKQIAGWENPPRFRLVRVGGGNDARWHVTLASLDRQLYRNFVLAPDAGREDDWLLPLRSGDRLAEHALYWFACEALARRDAAMIFSDDDEFEAEGRRCRPRFKPDWSLLHLRATDFIGRAVVLNGRAVTDAGGLRPENISGGTWDLLLRVAERAGDGIAHVPAVLLHRDAELERTQKPVFRRMRFVLTSPPPLVSIVIPTRDTVALLRQCVESVQAKTTYPRFEILVIDNSSTDPAALAYLAEIATHSGVRVLRYDRPFNFSAINNFAAREAKGEVLCLLNNDTEVISPDWLEEMVGHLHQDRVGVVGSKLYYPDGRVQHAGDTVGPGGCSHHLHSFLGHDDAGYCNRAVVVQELSAVTAACMLTWRELYLRLGGLDEANLPVAFNDVDFCLRVRAAGKRVVWTPYAELVHHESISRSKDRSLARRIRSLREVRYMRQKWREIMGNDPFYNPNFSYLRPDFALNRAPRISRPWDRIDVRHDDNGF
jgi:GT2 family glycosyltransferase